jgi:hypothetical protein
VKMGGYQMLVLFQQTEPHLTLHEILHYRERLLNADWPEAPCMCQGVYSASCG